MKMEDKFKVYDGTEEEKDVEIQEVQEELINEEVNDVKEQSEIEENVQQALGKDNKKFIEDAIRFIESGDNESLGSLMVEFQKNFDKKVMKKHKN